MSEERINTANNYFVGTAADGVRIMRAVPERLSAEDALRLAAWLVVAASAIDDDYEGWKKRFDDVYQACLNC